MPWALAPAATVALSALSVCAILRSADVVAATASTVTS